MISRYFLYTPLIFETKQVIAFYIHKKNETAKRIQVHVAFQNLNIYLLEIDHVTGALKKKLVC